MGNFIGKGTISLLGLLGAIVILLWGVRMIRKGMQKILIPYATEHNPIFHNKIYALFAGMFGAAFLQSSTALVLIISSVATKIHIPLNIGLAFVLGADVGTSLAAQLFSFNIKSIGPLLLFIGFFIQRSTTKEQYRQQVGQILMGLGFVLYGLSSINTIATEMRKSEMLSDLLSVVLIQDTFLAIIIAILLTWLSHSSLAIVLMTIEFVSSGVLTTDLGLSVVLGANIGACLPAYVDNIGQPIESRRLTFGNVIFRTIAGILTLPFLGYVSLLSQNVSLASGRFLALFHLVFNVSCALFFIFFTTPISKILMRLFPKKNNVSYKGIETKFIRTEEIHNVELSIINLTKEAIRLSEYIYIMLNNSSRALYNNKEIALITQSTNTSNTIYKSISKYLRKLYALKLEDKQSYFAMLINSYCTDLIQISDIITTNIYESLTNKHKKHISLSSTHETILNGLWQETKENLNLSQEVFKNKEEEIARQLIRRKDLFKKKVLTESLRHKKKLLEGDTHSIDINDIYLDLLNYLRRINSLITAVAYPVIENTDIELLH